MDPTADKDSQSERKVQLVSSSGIEGRLPSFRSIFPALESQNDEARRIIAEELRSYLQQISGHSFSKIEDGLEFSRQLWQLLNRLGLKLECPQCGKAAQLHLNTKVSKQGTFQFRHEGNLETSHGISEGHTRLPKGKGNIIPRLNLMSAKKNGA